MINPAHSIQNGSLSSDFAYFFEKIKHYGQQKKVEKGRLIISSGEICDKLIFVHSGVLRTFRLDADFNEITSGFTFSGDFDTVPESFFNRSPSQDNIVAISDSLLTIYPYNPIGDLVSKDPQLAKVIFKLLSAYVETLGNRLFDMRQGNAEKRYFELMKKQADEISKVPIGHLASYLGISKERMSRIRKKIH